MYNIFINSIKEDIRMKSLKKLQTPICGCFKQVIIDGMIGYVIDKSKPPCDDCKKAK